MIETKPSKKIKVAKIINEYQVVISCGSNQGVEVGDIYMIYGVGAEVRDPDTNKILGILNDEKAKIKVEQVYDEISVCCNAISGTSGLAESFGMLVGSINKLKPLNIDTSQMSGRFQNGSSLIAVGDGVRFVSKAKKDSKVIDETEDISRDLVMSN